MLGQGMPTVGAQFMRYYQLGIDGARMMSQQTANPDWHKKIVTIPINEAGVFPMPHDFVDYYYVAICANGKIVTLFHSPTSCPPMLDDCGDMIPQNSTNNGWWSYGGTDIYGTTVKSQYPDRGSFDINWEGRYFIVNRDGLDFDSIKLIYKTSIEQINGDYLIYEGDEWAIKEAIIYGLMKHNVRIPVSQKAFHKREMMNAKRIARRTNNPIRINEVLDVLRR